MSFCTDFVNPVLNRHNNMDTTPPYPKTITASPLILVRAMATHCGGVVRLVLFARAMDTAGSGAVNLDALKKAILSAGVTRQTYHDWKAGAVKHGLIEIKTRNSGEVVAVMIGEDRIAISLGVEHIDDRVEFDTVEILTGAWRTRAWEAHIATTYNGHMISRTKLAELTGIKRHEQIRLERRSSVRNHVNLVETNDSSDFVDGYRDAGRAAFEHHGKTMYRLPDTRTVVDGAVKMARRGRKRKINRELNSRGSLLHGAGLSNRVSKPRRIFYADHRSAHRALRAYGRADSDVSSVFVRVPCGLPRGATIWEQVNT
jgi:hypothetical protein